MPHLRQIRLSRMGLVLATMLLLCGSLAGFALGQVLAHNSSATALPLEDQRVSIAAATDTSGSAGAANGHAHGDHSGSGSQSGATSGSKSGITTGSTAHAGRSGSSSSSVQQHSSAASTSTGMAPSSPKPSQSAGSKQERPSGNTHSQHGQSRTGHGKASDGKASGGNPPDESGHGNGSGVNVAQTSNGQTVTVSGDGSSVTISSNGSGTSVSVTSGGDQQDTGSASLSCSAAQLRRSWPAIAAPLRQDEVLIVRQGSALPVRFQLQGGCAGKGIVQARLYLAPLNGDFIPALPAGASNQENVFRFDTRSGQYVYNLTTRGLPPGMYQLGIDLGNGQLFVVPFALR